MADMDYDKMLRKYESLRLSSPIRSNHRHRLIVGIDYGTTYSGVSFVTTDKTSIDDIQVISSWPAQDAQSLWKVPTRIAYKKENPNRRMHQDAWGCAVRADMVSCAWTKLLLDADAEGMQYDDPGLQDAIDQGILHVPNSADFHKSAQEVCEDFLHHVYLHMLDKVTAQIGEDFLQATPMDCWLTVPAVWSDKAQDTTMAAAKKAGFGSRPGDNIYIISEPEAAAIATFKTKTKPDAINPPVAGENILICDCGGGTVDITTYTIIETAPSLIFDELCVGIGGKCGSTYIDRNLHQLMLERFGSHFDTVEMRRKGPGSMFMESWERVKRSYRYGARDSAYDIELGPINMNGVPSSEYYDQRESMVLLTSADIEGLFKPVVEDILGLVQEQVSKVANLGQSIQRLILVGGFADSQYLLQSVRAWGGGNGGIQVLCAAHPQAAIVQGAALRGLEGTAPRKKRCRRHYGLVIGAPFREGIDPEHKAYYTAIDGVKRCRDRMDWLINKGTPIKGSERRQTTLWYDLAKGSDMRMEISLYSCSLDVPPEYKDSDRIEKVGTVKLDLSRANRTKAESKRVGNGGFAGLFGTKHWKLHFQLEVIFGGAKSSLDFRTLVDGVVSGTASIDFD